MARLTRRSEGMFHTQKHNLGAFLRLLLMSLSMSSLQFLSIFFVVPELLPSCDYHHNLNCNFGFPIQMTPSYLDKL